MREKKRHVGKNLFEIPQRSMLIVARDVVQLKERLQEEVQVKPEQIVSVHEQGYDRTGQKKYRVIYQVMV